MKKIGNLFGMVAVLLVGLSFATTVSAATQKPTVIVVGGSYASSHLPILATTGGEEAPWSRNTLIQGKYRGICDELPLVLRTKANVSCPAVAAALSADFPLDSLGAGLTGVVPGYDAQLSQGIREVSWDGALPGRTYLVITLTSDDGPGVIEETRRVIERAQRLGFKGIVVQAFPVWESADFQREFDTAIANHGEFFGGILRNFLVQTGTLTQTSEQYAAQANAHKEALGFYPGVSYLDLYPGLRSTETFDGVHPFRPASIKAAKIIKKAVGF